LWILLYVNYSSAQQTEIKFTDFFSEKYWEDCIPQLKISCDLLWVRTIQKLREHTEESFVSHWSLGRGTKWVSLQESMLQWQPPLWPRTENAPSRDSGDWVTGQNPHSLQEWHARSIVLKSKLIKIFSTGWIGCK
jgi:hypothetical protein